MPRGAGQTCWRLSTLQAPALSETTSPLSRNTTWTLPSLSCTARPGCAPALVGIEAISFFSLISATKIMSRSGSEATAVRPSRRTKSVPPDKGGGGVSRLFATPDSELPLPPTLGKPGVPGVIPPRSGKTGVSPGAGSGALPEHAANVNPAPAIQGAIEIRCAITLSCVVRLLKGEAAVHCVAIVPEEANVILSHL